MTTFADLPNEVLSEILFQAMPHSIEPLAAVSRHFHHLAVPLLQEHRKLRRQYSTLGPMDLEGVWGRGDWTAKLFMLVVNNPRLAQYIVNVQSSYRSHSLATTPDPGHNGLYHLPYHADVLSRLEHAVRSTDSIPAEEVPDWITAIQSGDERPIVALLLPRLPNLHTLTCGSITEASNDKVVKMVDPISGKANSGERMSRLEQVNAYYDHKLRLSPRVYVASVRPINTIWISHH